MMLASVNHVYRAVNIAGAINDTLLSPRALLDGWMMPVPVPTVTAPQPFISRVGQAFRATSLDAHDRARTAMVEMLCIRRSPPFCWLGELPIVALFLGFGYLPLYHPFADLCVGRGHNVKQVRHPEIELLTTERVFNMYNSWTHHGAVGLVIEAAPVRAAQYLADRQYEKAACACMGAAILGRGLLQVPRLAICAQALAIECLWMLPVFGSLFAIELLARGIVGAISLVGVWTGMSWERVAGWLSLGQDSVAEDDTAVDSGKPGADQRIRERLAKLNKRLKPVYQSETATPQQILAVVDGMAADLRRYCKPLSGDEALRGGLALLKATVEQLWSEEPAVVFEPPELACRVQLSSTAAAQLSTASGNDVATEGLSTTDDVDMCIEGSKKVCR